MCIKEMWGKCPCSEKLTKIAQCKIRILETCGMSISNLIIRLWVALVFWKSAATKVVSTTDVTIFGEKIPLIHMPYELQSSTYMLFEYEYMMPFPEVTALFATAAEVFLPLMLLFGLGTRIAALGLFIMTLVIHFTYMVDPTHYVWMMLTGVLITTGAGKFSFDHFIRKSILQDVGRCAKK